MKQDMPKRAERRRASHLEGFGRLTGAVMNERRPSHTGGPIEGAGQAEGAPLLWLVVVPGAGVAG